jgi:hypothetical protein
MMTLQSANAQKEDDYIGLLIECYQFLYAPESIYSFNPIIDGKFLKNMQCHIKHAV